MYGKNVFGRIKRLGSKVIDYAEKGYKKVAPLLRRYAIPALVGGLSLAGARWLADSPLGDQIRENAGRAIQTIQTYKGTTGSEREAFKGQIGDVIGRTGANLLLNRATERLVRSPSLLDW